jgi:hypothetical protein
MSRLVGIVEIDVNAFEFGKARIEPFNRLNNIKRKKKQRADEEVQMGLDKGSQLISL